MLQYADDLVIYSTGKDASVLAKYIEETLQRLSEFFGGLGLSISPSKSELMVFSRKHQTPQPTIMLDGAALQNVTKFKYLGIMFDTKLTWRPHVDLIQKKVL